MKFLNYGSLNIDKIYEVEHFVRAKETCASLSYYELPGGKGLNQSIALARLNIPVYHAGKIGKDGLFLKDLLEKQGVNTKYLQISDEVSGHAIIQVDQQGENCILLYGGANQTITSDEIKMVFKDFSKGNCLFLQNEVNRIDEMINLAKEKEMLVVLNPSPVNNIKEKISFEQIDYLILNEVEGQVLTNQEKPEKILETLIQEYPHIKIILTLGSQGAIYQDCQQIIRQSAYPCSCLDTTGAGDTFTGFFFSVYFTSNDISYALKKAAQASSLAITRKGGASAIPTWQELEKIIRRILWTYS